MMKTKKEASGQQVFPAPEKELFLQLLKKYWGYDGFRGIQEEIILSIFQGKDTLGLMPTGGGKSITFQIPALAMKGTCIVVTPLIALMKDQVQNLRDRYISATAVYSGLSHDQILTALENCINGGVKFLYVSPERLSTKLFQTKLRHMKVSFITVDEAHCISQWGYDFRPAYLEIAQIRKIVPDVPVLALTASATPFVVEDICRQLAFREGAHVFRMSFERKNLSYVVRHAEDKYAELLHILNNVRGSAIVYTRSRQGTREVAEVLRREGISSLYYHAGLTNLDKDIRQQAWQEGSARVMVATNAFGMGIDKPDVRLVIHLDLPDSVEAYFQEAGRAGRDGRRAYAVLLFNRSDETKLKRRIPDTFPDKDYIRKVYEKLCFFFELAVGDGFNVRYELNIEKFCSIYKLFPVPMENALQILSYAGYIDYEAEAENASRVIFITSRNELYALRAVSPNAEAVIRALLRNYGGLFSDYVFIQEDLLARDAELSKEDVYEILKDLTHQRILHYVPRKSAPYVRFLQRRVETADIVLSESAYEKRKADYEKRVTAMLDYARRSDICRSRYLLGYFGEETNHDCGCCDVCVEGKRNQDVEDVCRRLRELFADGCLHGLEDIRLPHVSPKRLSMALSELISREELIAEDGRYRLRKK